MELRLVNKDDREFLKKAAHRYVVAKQEAVAAVKELNEATAIFGDYFRHLNPIGSVHINDLSGGDHAVEPKVKISQYGSTKFKLMPVVKFTQCESLETGNETHFYPKYRTKDACWFIEVGFPGKVAEEVLRIHGNP